MINTQKFNLSKFNVAGNKKTSMSATITATSEMRAVMNVRYAMSAEIAAKSEMTAKPMTKVIQLAAQPITATSEMSANWYKRIILEAEPVYAISEMSAKSADIYGIDIISLPDLVLKPGQELIIDTDNMTVTLDGQNAIHLLSDDSVFFFLAQGEDLITYADNSGSRQANLKVMWKDRWL